MKDVLQEITLSKLIMPAIQIVAIIATLNSVKNSISGDMDKMSLKIESIATDTTKIKIDIAVLSNTSEMTTDRIHNLEKKIENFQK